jgi:hypothetical protein
MYCVKTVDCTTLYIEKDLLDTCSYFVEKCIDDEISIPHILKDFNILLQYLESGHIEAPTYKKIRLLYILAKHYNCTKAFEYVKPLLIEELAIQFEVIKKDIVVGPDVFYYSDYIDRK